MLQKRGPLTISKSAIGQVQICRSCRGLNRCWLLDSAGYRVAAQFPAPTKYLTWRGPTSGRSLCRCGSCGPCGRRAKCDFAAYEKGLHAPDARQSREISRVDADGAEGRRSLFYFLSANHGPEVRLAFVLTTYECFV